MKTKYQGNNYTIMINVYIININNIEYGIPNNNKKIRKEEKFLRLIHNIIKLIPKFTINKNC